MGLELNLTSGLTQHWTCHRCRQEKSLPVIGQPMELPMGWYALLVGTAVGSVGVVPLCSTGCLAGHIAEHCDA